MLLLQAYAEFLPGDRLGLTVRGGREFGLGVFVTGVERGSIARAMGLQVGNVDFFVFSFNVRYSTLLHLPPLRLHCVGGCRDRTQDCCDFGTYSQAL
jgi:hypothetical protein